MISEPESVFSAFFIPWWERVGASPGLDPGERGEANIPYRLAFVESGSVVPLDSCFHRNDEKNAQK